MDEPLECMIMLLLLFMSHSVLLLIYGAAAFTLVAWRLSISSIAACSSAVLYLSALVALSDGHEFVDTQDLT